MLIIFNAEFTKSKPPSTPPMLLGTNFATITAMPQIHIHNIIQSGKAKTTEHALAVVQTLRSMGRSEEPLQLDFSGITWITSMFADRLVRALATYYGENFEQKLQVTGVEPTNVMFSTLWKSALNKVKLSEVLAEA